MSDEYNNEYLQEWGRMLKSAYLFSPDDDVDRRWARVAEVALLFNSLPGGLVRKEGDLTNEQLCYVFIGDLWHHPENIRPAEWDAVFGDMSEPEARERYQNTVRGRLP